MWNKIMSQDGFAGIHPVPHYKLEEGKHIIELTAAEWGIFELNLKRLSTSTSTVHTSTSNMRYTVNSSTYKTWILVYNEIGNIGFHKLSRSIMLLLSIAAVMMYFKLSLIKK